MNLLKELVTMWTTIRGFSMAATWLEQYKKAQQAQSTVAKSKALRKKLKRDSEEKVVEN